MVWPLTADKLTLKRALVVVPASPSFTLALVMVRDGAGSSLKISPRPKLRPMTALVGLNRLTRNALMASFSVLPITGTVMVWFVTPGEKTRVPAVGTRSEEHTSEL